MWNSEEWGFFKQNLISMLKKTDCILVLADNTKIYCNLRNIDKDSSLTELWVNNTETLTPVLIDLNFLKKVIRLD
jgi:hypothetical protein